MFTNADITLYLYSKEGKTERYKKHIIRSVYWEDIEQSTFLKTGQRNACNAMVLIPFSSIKNKLDFTKGKDLVIKGVIDEDIDCTTQATMSQSLDKLRAKLGALTLASVAERLYGSKSVWHYELSCK
nr:MAG TPA: hypothetical protein [Caudoviricetes sp.]